MIGVSLRVWELDSYIEEIRIKKCGRR